MDGSTLADDEAALRRHADALADAVEQVSADWIRRLVIARAPILEGDDGVDAAAAAAAEAIDVDLRALLARDIAEQPSGPLEVLRRHVSFATAVLRDAGVPPVPRDEFAERNFPDDVYDLSPASFAAVDPSLHEPGIVWGAAKAHVHLRRRREQTG